MYDQDHHLLDDEDALQMALTKTSHKRNNGFDRRKNKGLAANHLLNFSLPQRNNDPVPILRKKKGPPPRTRDEYLHANFRFVISPLGKDEIPALYDPDALIEWDKIEQVIVAGDSSDQRCPICLDTLRAPKITRCGHIYCWHCILTYLSMTENYWRRCPMCFDSVKKTDLRSVLIHPDQTIPFIGDNVTFQYVHRERHSWFPHLPTENANKEKLPSVHDNNAPFSRVLESTSLYLEQMIENEMIDLDALAQECQSSGDISTLPILDEALIYCKKRLEKIIEKKDEKIIEKIIEKKSEKIIEKKDEKIIEKNGEKKSEKKDIKIYHNENEQPYTFYQLNNGYYVILHPLCMKILTYERNKTEKNFPFEINGQVLDVEHIIMNEDIKKRYRFLSHLPFYSDIYFIELNMLPLVSSTTLLYFQNDLKKRLKQRQIKNKKNEKKFKKNQINIEIQQFQNPMDQNISTMASFYPSTDAISMEEDTTPSWPNVDALPNMEEFNISNGKKTKKGISLFATSQRRSYRY